MSYIVGDGILKRMRQMGTEPASSQLFFKNPDGTDAWSEAMGMDGKAYRYLNATNQVLAFDPTSWVIAGAGPDPSPPASAPTVIDNAPGNVAGAFAATPLGVILHGTRSGQNYSARQEFAATVNYVRNGAGGLGWNLSIGPGIIATHIDPRRWGWNARSASRNWLSAEFAQAKVDQAISIDQVDAFVWWFRSVARAVWPSLRAEFPTHAELPEGIADGKTDPFPVGDARADELRARIRARL